jgi:hypothetical protein
MPRAAIALVFAFFATAATSAQESFVTLTAGGVSATSQRRKNGSKKKLSKLKKNHNSKEF